MSRKSLAFLSLFLFFIFSLARAESWDTISLPNQTTLLKEEEMLLNNQKIKTIRGRSRLSENEIRNFYLRFLPGLGWREGCPECRQQSGGRAPLSFIRGDTKLSIVIIPTPLGKEGENELIIAMLKLKSEAAAAEAAQDAAASDSPGQDLAFIPRYPESQRVSSMESDSSQRVTLTYRTSQPADAVLDFYRQNMPVYDWQLVDETNFQDLPPGLEEIQSKINLQGGSLIFKGPRGESIITVFKMPEQAGGGDFRIIGIKYKAK